MFKNQDEKLRLIQPGMIIIGVDVAKRSHWMQPMHYNGILIVKAFNIKNTREGFESLVVKIELIVSRHCRFFEPHIKAFN